MLLIGSDIANWKFTGRTYANNASIRCYLF
jgi:hypothetical protein